MFPLSLLKLLKSFGRQICYSRFGHIDCSDDYHYSLYYKKLKYGSWMLPITCSYIINVIFEAWRHSYLQAITALKKGAYLLKYGRRGKPKFCPFRLSNVSILCTLQLNSVSVPAQPSDLYGVFYAFFAPSGWICIDMVLRERRETFKVEPCI